MARHNPPRPGEFITAVYLEPNGISGRELASKLGVSPSTLNRILTGRSTLRRFARTVVTLCSSTDRTSTCAGAS